MGGGEWGGRGALAAVVVRLWFNEIFQHDWIQTDLLISGPNGTKLSDSENVVFLIIKLGIR